MCVYIEEEGFIAYKNLVVIYTYEMEVGLYHFSHDYIYILTLLHATKTLIVSCELRESNSIVI